MAIAGGGGGVTKRGMGVHVQIRGVDKMKLSILSETRKKLLLEGVLNTCVPKGH